MLIFGTIFYQIITIKDKKSMKKIYFYLNMVCALLLSGTLNAQDAPKTSSHHQLGTEINYPLSRISPNGRYMGGWDNGISSIYDSETNQTITSIGGCGTAVYLVSINDDGSMWASHVTTTGLQYGLYKNGNWTYLPKPEGFSGGWLKHVTVDNKYAINSYTNTLLNNNLESDAYLYERQEDGTYQYRKLTKPLNDCWTESEVYHVDPMRVSTDGSVILGHVVDGEGFYILPIVWTRNEQGEYDYKVKAESFCFNLDQPSPGNQPDIDEMVTAPEGTPEYDEQMAAYEAAVQEWNALAENFLTGMAIAGYPTMDNNGTIIGTSLFTGDSSKGHQPLFLSTTDDSYTLIDYFMTKTQYVCDNGTAFLINEFFDGIHHNVVYTPGNTTPVAFDKWLKSEYGLNIEPMYVHDIRVTVGTPSLSFDGKTLAFTLKNANGNYLNHYYRLDKSLNTTTSIESTSQDSHFRVYTNGKTLYINEGAPYDVRIIDMGGKTVSYTTNVYNSLDLNNLPTGVYVAAVKQLDGKTEFFKIFLAN